MGIGGFTAAEGVLRFTTATNDPALHGPAMKLDASKYTALEVTLRGTGDRDTVRDAMQLFWSRGGSMSEAQSVRVPVTHDGEWHTVQFDLGNHPRWRGVITRLRLDPSVRRGVAIEIARIAFVTQGE